jgi:tripartite-type tricarboxylate transporter receptor subunit TctC
VAVACNDVGMVPNATAPPRPLQVQVLVLARGDAVLAVVSAVLAAVPGSGSSSGSGSGGSSGGSNSTSPGVVPVALAGNGTAHHLTVELYKTMTRTFMTHIPYRGAGPALQDLLAGQVDFMFDGLGSSMPFIKSGRLVPLAGSSDKRSFALPDVPTLAEVGVRGYDARTWYAVWAPAGTPSDMVLRMQQEIAKALAGKELKDTWTALGAEAGGQSPDDMRKFVDAEIGKWSKVVKDSGAKLD